MNVLIALIGGNNNDPCHRVYGANASNGLNAQPIRKLKIHQSDIRTMFHESLQCTLYSPCFGAHFNMLLPLEQRHNAKPGDGVIVNNKYSNRFVFAEYRLHKDFTFITQLDC